MVDRQRYFNVPRTMLVRRTRKEGNVQYQRVLAHAWNSSLFGCQIVVCFELSRGTMYLEDPNLQLVPRLAQPPTSLFIRQ